MTRRCRVRKARHSGARVTLVSKRKPGRLAGFHDEFAYRLITTTQRAGHGLSERMRSGVGVGVVSTSPRDTDETVSSKLRINSRSPSHEQHEPMHPCLAGAVLLGLCVSVTAHEPTAGTEQSAGDAGARWYWGIAAHALNSEGEHDGDIVTDLDYLGPRVFGGRRISEYLSIEAEIGRATFQGQLWSGRLNTDLRMWNLAATALFHIPWESSPIEPFAYAGLGVSFWDYEVRGQTSEGSYHLSDSSSDFYWHVGAGSAYPDHNTHHRTGRIQVLAERHAAATRPMGGPSGRLLLYAARHRGGGPVEILMVGDSSAVISYEIALTSSAARSDRANIRACSSSRSVSNRFSPPPRQSPTPSSRPSS